MKKTPLLVGLIMIVSVGIIPGTAAAQEDDWPDKCSEAPVVESGTISGEIHKSSDVDRFLIRLQKGQYINISTEYPSEKTQDPVIGINPPSVEFNDNVEIRGVQYGSEDSLRERIYLDSSRQKHHFELWAVTNEFSETPLCIEVRDWEWETPYGWELNIERSDPDVTLFEVRELEDRIVELQNQLDNTEGDSERVSELESQLEQKNQRISELESQIDELESQNSGTGGDVVIDVTVNPANGQENFVEGGEALVQAESKDADVSGMQVEYGAGTYELDSSGEVAVPLADSGMQEMTVVHGDTTEEVSIDVQSQSESQQTTADDGDETSDSGSDSLGPGFGIITAVVALVASALLAARNQ